MFGLGLGKAYQGDVFVAHKYRSDFGSVLSDECLETSYEGYIMWPSTDQLSQCFAEQAEQDMYNWTHLKI